MYGIEITYSSFQFDGNCNISKLSPFTSNIHSKFYYLDLDLLRGQRLNINMPNEGGQFVQYLMTSVVFAIFVTIARQANSPLKGSRPLSLDLAYFIYKSVNRKRM